jgi:hypothetical protein
MLRSAPQGAQEPFEAQSFPSCMASSQAITLVKSIAYTNIRYRVPAPSQHQAAKTSPRSAKPFSAPMALRT